MTQNTILALGTVVRIIVDHPDSNEALRIMDLAFSRLRRLEDRMSAYRPDSEIGTLNEKGCCDRLSADTREVIGRAMHYWKLTGGAFDVTIHPVLKGHEALSRSGKSGEPYGKKASPAGLGLVNSQDVIVADEGVRFGKKGMGINLGGIAKGYAVDAAVEVLRQNGIMSALVDAGGDLKVIGTRPDGTPWRIGLGDPRSILRIASVVALSNCAVATSGTYRRRSDDIIDARDGRIVKDVLRATVVAEEAVDADALATSVTILGLKKGIDLIDGLDGVGALILAPDGAVVESSRWSSLTSFKEGRCPMNG